MKGKSKVRKVMHEFKEGALRSGSPSGPKVKKRKQAIAIALSEAREEEMIDGADDLMLEDRQPRIWPAIVAMIGVLLAAASAFAQTPIPNVVGSQYNSSPPTVASGQLVPMKVGNDGTVAVSVSSTAGTADVNVKQVNGVTTSTGAGATGTGTQRVGVAQDATTIAGSAPGTAGTASANVVSVQGVASMTPVQTTPVVGTTGGATSSFLQPTASDNHAVIKAGAGTLYGVIAQNSGVTINYLRYYNATTGFNGCNSATNLITQIQVPPSGGAAPFIPVGIAFATGLSICVTSGYATTDTTNATPSVMSITTVYN